MGPADFGRAVPRIASRFWAEDDADAYEPKGGRVISPTTIAEHASWFRRTKMSGLVLPGLDAQRLFSHEQRHEIWDRYGGKCGICGQALTSGEEEYDHVVPWISGGRTEFGNGRPQSVPQPGCRGRRLSLTSAKSHLASAHPVGAACLRSSNTIIYGPQVR